MLTSLPCNIFTVSAADRLPNLPLWHQGSRPAGARWRSVPRWHRLPASRHAGHPLRSPVGCARSRGARGRVAALKVAWWTADRFRPLESVTISWSRDLVRLARRSTSTNASPQQPAENKGCRPSSHLLGCPSHPRLGLWDVLPVPMHCCAPAPPTS